MSVLQKFIDGDWIRHINPTVILTIALSAFWFIFTSSALYLYKLPFYAYLPFCALQTLVVFMMFTPFHEACHYVASKRTWLNELILVLNWPIFIGNPFMFRKIHWQHHARTNQEGRDPDHFTAHPSMAMRVLKSFFLFFYYHYFAFKKFRSWKLRAHTVASLFTPLAMIYLAVVTPFTLPILFVWILPAFLASGLLCYFNTAFPHHPAKETERMRTTRNSYLPWAAQVVMLNQNLHLVHHLNPRLAWYEYPQYWKNHEREMIQKGARVVVFTKRRQAYALLPHEVLVFAQKLRDTINIYLP